MTRRPYMFPLLLAGEQPAVRGLEDTCHNAIHAAWRCGKPFHEGASIKAARMDLARWRLTPADLVAVVQALVAYNQRPWPVSDDEKNAPIRWMWYENLPLDHPRRGTYYDARIAARASIAAGLSILLEVPVEHAADEATLLQTLILADWQVPRHQRERVAQRMARYVAGCARRQSFAPVNGGAA
ncbi:MAG: hypothetical protein GEV13_28525 [Rhodospirillales bacterium]|nr:hypothetical protein [Rhodospirillales bacterium]